MYWDSGLPSSSANSFVFSKTSSSSVTLIRIFSGFIGFKSITSGKS